MNFNRGFTSDYDYPIHKSPSQQREQVRRAQKRIHFQRQYLFKYRFKQCIHGHFLASKYKEFYGDNDNVFVTWLRDPIERLASQYYYWQGVHDGTFRSETEKTLIRYYGRRFRERMMRRTFPLYRKVVEEGWTLREFAFSEELKNIYSKYLWDFPLDKFDFVGITEYYDQDIKFFSKYFLGLEGINVPQINRIQDRPKSYFKDKGLIRDIKAFHARDYEIYNDALQAREKHSNRC